MKAEVRIVTPDTAKEMLKRNSSNRKYKDSWAVSLSNSMINGEWIFDGTPIQFSDDGTLLNGQHRLNAIVKSKTSQKMLILTGIEKEAFQVMDTGRLRSGSDVLGMEGVEYSSATSSAIRFILGHKKGLNARGSDTFSSTNSSILNFYRNNSNINSIMVQAHKYYLSFDRVLSHSQVASYLFLMSEKNTLEAESFWRKTCSGLGLSDGDPELVLRKKLISDKISKSSMSPAEKKALIIKAWNYRRKDIKIKILRWNKETEKFPVAI